MNNDELLITAAQNGYTEEVKRLIPISDPLYKKSEALWRAVLHGHTECVRLLAPISDVKDEHSVALQMASSRGDQIIFDILYPFSDPEEALQQMKEDDDTDEDRRMLEARLQADRERKIIEDNICTNNKSDRRSKI